MNRTNQPAPSEFAGALLKLTLNRNYPFIEHPGRALNHDHHDRSHLSRFFSSKPPEPAEAQRLKSKGSSKSPSRRLPRSIPRLLRSSNCASASAAPSPRSNALSRRLAHYRWNCWPRFLCSRFAGRNGISIAIQSSPTSRELFGYPMSASIGDRSHAPPRDSGTGL